MAGAPIYLNNAATSWPRLPAVREAVSRYLEALPTGAGRGGDSTGDVRRPLRAAISQLFGTEPDFVVLPHSATVGLNMVIATMIHPGDHVVCSNLEHNAVLRPLRHRHANVEIVKARGGLIHVEGIANAIRPDTRMVVLTQVSNVTGCVQEVLPTAQLAADAGIPLLVDASQGAGAVPLDHSKLPGRVFIAAAGHKGLQGPPGTGVLVVPDAHVPQWIVGGTGALGSAKNHPPMLPMRHEAGTPDTPALAGLLEGVRWLIEYGVDRIGAHKHELVMYGREVLAEVPELRMMPLCSADGRGGIITFTLKGHEPEELAWMLREIYDIYVRGGLHCAPLANPRWAPRGTVRASFGPFTTTEDIDALAHALRELGSE